jgi:hypothetical protein
MILKISSSDISMFQNGNGQFVKYSILETPSENSIIIKKDDGSIETYHLEGKRIWLGLSGYNALKFKIYFNKID